MEMSLIEEGLKFLVLGMTTVYVFLYVMVLVLKVEAKIVQRYFPPVKKPSVSSFKKSKPSVQNDESEDEIVAAITAAIIEHRKK